MFNFFKKQKRIRAREIDKDFFKEEVVFSKKAAIITFVASWCEACKMQKPLIDDLAHTHRDSNIIVGVVNTDRCDLVRDFHIKGIPTTTAFKNGEIVFRKSGPLSRGNLEQIVRELTKTS